MLKVMDIARASTGVNVKGYVKSSGVNVKGNGHSQSFKWIKFKK